MFCLTRRKCCRFMLIPLLFELRTAIDWTWTDTSMPLFDFFNMENFYAVIYNLKCARTFEQSFPAPRGEAKGKVVKYLMGLPMILLLILVIWSPLLAFSMLNQIGLVKTPVNVKLTISVGGFPVRLTADFLSSWNLFSLFIRHNRWTSLRLRRRKWKTNCDKLATL